MVAPLLERERVAATALDREVAESVPGRRVRQESARVALVLRRLQLLLLALFANLRKGGARVTRLGANEEGRGANARWRR